MEQIITTVSLGGNILINVGPTSQGKFVKNRIVKFELVNTRINFFIFPFFPMNSIEFIFNFFCQTNIFTPCDSKMHQSKKFYSSIEKKENRKDG